MQIQDQPTHDWLLLELLAGQSAALTARLNGLTAEAWHDLAVEAHRQGVAPLLLRRLQVEGAGLTWPAAVRDMLTGLQRQTAVANMQAYRQLLELLGALRQRGVTAVALKGIQIAQIVYGNVALRPMTDLDLLIRRADLPPVEAALAALGYAPFTQLAERQWYLDHHYHLDYLRPEAGARLIELHWDLVYPGAPFRIDLDGLWARAQTHTIAGAPVRFLAPEDLVLHLCLQMTYQHLCDYFPLRLLVDIRACLRSYAPHFDWPAFTARAQGWGAARHVYFTLALAHNWLDAPVPAEALRALQPPDLDPRFEAYARQRMRRFGASRPADAPRSDGLATVWLAPDWGARLRALAGVMRPPAFGQPPEAAGGRRFGRFLAYPRRWRALAARHFSRGWRLARRDHATTDWATAEVERARLESWLQVNRRPPPPAPPPDTNDVC